MNNKLWVFILILMALMGCSTSSRQIVGQKRPAISVDEVQLYQIKPDEYEQIAFIQASSKNSLSFTDDGMQDVAIDRLKEEAAALGANGVLLITSEDEVTGSLGTGSGVGGRNVSVGIGLSFPITNKLIKAVAIYVAPEAAAKNHPPAEQQIEQE